MMKLEAPERDVLPASPAVLRLPPAALLVVAGVPGAGKTTLLSRVDASESLVLDPEPIRARYQRLLGRAPTGGGARWSTPSTSSGSCSPSRVPRA